MPRWNQRQTGHPEVCTWNVCIASETRKEMEDPGWEVGVTLGGRSPVQQRRLRFSPHFTTIIEDQASLISLHCLILYDLVFCTIVLPFFAFFLHVENYMTKATAWCWEIRGARSCPCFGSLYAWSCHVLPSCPCTLENWEICGRVELTACEESQYETCIMIHDPNWKLISTYFYYFKLF